MSFVAIFTNRIIKKRLNYRAIPSRNIFSYVLYWFSLLIDCSCSHIKYIMNTANYHGHNPQHISSFMGYNRVPNKRKSFSFTSVWGIANSSELIIRFSWNSQSLVLYLRFINHWHFNFGLCIFCSSIYGFELPFLAFLWQQRNSPN